MTWAQWGSIYSTHMDGLGYIHRTHSLRPHFPGGKAQAAFPATEKPWMSSDREGTAAREPHLVELGFTTTGQEFVELAQEPQVGVPQPRRAAVCACPCCALSVRCGGNKPGKHGLLLACEVARKTIDSQCSGIKHSPSQQKHACLTPLMSWKTRRACG